MNKIGLALSGGGIRGMAHIGVLQALEEAEIPVHALSGSSIGGLVAAAYAAGMSPQDMLHEVERFSNLRQLLTIVDWGMPQRGLLQGHKAMEYLARWIGDVTFDQLDISLALVTADIKKGERIIQREGSVLEAVRATIAMPGLFAPVERGEQLLVDGGLLDNLPTSAARDLGADVVVAVDVATDRESIFLFTEGISRRWLIPDGLVDIVGMLVLSLETMIREINRRNMAESPPDLLVCPAIPAGVTVLTGLSQTEGTIAAGKQAMTDALPKLRELTQAQA
ncbi:MAG: patatin-like phospholipase family protein [Anaerolineae bacterium]|nr:patatin-like phospholipase family protein [Anaerolineae bacterium]